MSTQFNGSTSYMEIAGANYGRLAKLGAVFHGGQAMAALWKPNGVGAYGLFHDHNSVASVNPYNDTKLYFSVKGFIFADTGTAGPGRFYSASDGWRLDVFTSRDNGSNITVRLHSYNYGTGTWTHDDLTTTLGNGNDPFQSPGTIGAFNEGGTGQSLDGKIAAIAVWGTGGDQLTDAQIEGMTGSLGAWADLNPTALWSLEDATSKPTDVLGVGIEATTKNLLVHSTDEPSGWSYNLNTKSGLYLGFSQFINSSGDTTETLTSDNFTPGAGDVLVAKVTTWDTGNHMTVSGGGLTWTKRAEKAPGGFNGYAAVWTAVATGSEGSMAVSAVPDANCRHTLTVERWVGGQLAATPATASGNGSGLPSVNITTTAANSVVTWASFDMNSQNPLTRVYRNSGVEDGIWDGHYGANSVHYGAYAKVGAAGTYAMGMTAPASQLWVLAGVEIQPADVGSPDEYVGSAALAITESITASGHVTAVGSATLAISSALSTSLVRGVSSGASTSFAVSITASGRAGYTRSAAPSFAVAITASGGINVPVTPQPPADIHISSDYEVRLRWRP